MRALPKQFSGVFIINLKILKDFITFVFVVVVTVAESTVETGKEDLDEQPSSSHCFRKSLSKCS